MVSSLGRIQSQAGAISRGYQTRQGYLKTLMTLHVQKRCESVHRLVAFAFLGPPANPERNQVNHKDGDKQNNAVENLEFVTAAENIAHRYANSMPACRLRSGKAVESRLCGSNDEWQWHPSMNSAARLLQVNTGGISRCVNGMVSCTGGYEFRLSSQQAHEVFADEAWRKVDIEAHMLERAGRK